MKLKLILTTAIVGAALALPSVSSAAPPAPTLQDSVVLTGAPALSDVGVIDYLNATSGPNGENPTGRVDFGGEGSFLHSSGPVTCLAVSGNLAILNFRTETGLFSGGILTVLIVDNLPDSFNPAPTFRDPTDCSPIGFDVFGPRILHTGDITVVDVQGPPPPTTRDQCINGGWAQFGFANLGECIAYVNYPHR
jgi:hypothetical protein